MRFSVNARHFGSFWRDLLYIFVYGEQHHFTQIETHRATAADTSQYQQKKKEKIQSTKTTPQAGATSPIISLPHIVTHTLLPRTRDGDVSFVLTNGKGAGTMGHGWDK